MMKALSLHVFVHLSRYDGAREFCEVYKKNLTRVDGLVCKAGMVNQSGPKKITHDGIETNIGISYSGHFLMTELLLDLLKRVPPSRHLILSSVILNAGSPSNRFDVNLDDLAFEKHAFSNFAAYGEARVACCLYALELAVETYPGWARSNFGSGGPWYKRAVRGGLCKPLSDT